MDGFAAWECEAAKPPALITGKIGIQTTCAVGSESLRQTASKPKPTSSVCVTLLILNDLDLTNIVRNCYLIVFWQWFARACAGSDAHAASQAVFNQEPIG